MFENYTVFDAAIDYAYLQVTTETILFPGEWVRTCVTREQLEDEQIKVQLVVDGELMGESVSSDSQILK